MAEVRDGSGCGGAAHTDQQRQSHPGQQRAALPAGIGIAGQQPGEPAERGAQTRAWEAETLPSLAKIPATARSVNAASAV